MIEDKLRLNTKVFSFDGIMGRRDFFLNLVYITALSLFFIVPVTIWLAVNMQTANELFSLNILFYKSPILLKLYYTIGMIGTYVLFISNIIRRLNDINGKINNTLNILFCIIFALSYFSLIFPFILAFVSNFIFMIIGLFLFIKKGQITSNFPYDFMKEFNWGAFFGTWIWGLFNKSYIPLLNLILFFTPWNFLFMFYCGLKGNEWAYKKKSIDIDAFNKSQEKQATFWIIFNLVFIPVLTFILAIIFVSMAMIMPSVNPQRSEKIMNTMEQIIEKSSSIYFANYTIEDNENKFYVYPKDWNNYGFSEKQQIMDIAAETAATKRRSDYKKRRAQQIDNLNPEQQKEFRRKYRREYYSKTTELPRTKIYSVYDKQLLGEFVFDEEVFNKKDVKFTEVLKETFKSYRFYQAKNTNSTK